MSISAQEKSVSRYLLYRDESSLYREDRVALISQSGRSLSITSQEKKSLYFLNRGESPLALLCNESDSPYPHYREESVSILTTRKESLYAHYRGESLSIPSLKEGVSLDPRKIRSLFIF